MFFVPLGGGSQSDDSSVLTGKADLELFARVTMVSPTFRKISNAINYFFFLLFGAWSWLFQVLFYWQNNRDLGIYGGVCTVWAILKCNEFI